MICLILELHIMNYTNTYIILTYTIYTLYLPILSVYSYAFIFTNYIYYNIYVINVIIGQISELKQSVGFETGVRDGRGLAVFSTIIIIQRPQYVFFQMMKLIGICVERRFDRKCTYTRDTQDNILRRILSVNGQTAYGRDHGFSTIRHRGQVKQPRVTVNDATDYVTYIIIYICINCIERCIIY